MSFNPLSFPLASYIGAPSRQQHKLCTALIEPPSTVPLQINWADYGVSLLAPNVSIQLDLTAQKNMISAIRGIYIDNTQSGGRVYVTFPDTGYTVTCKEYATASDVVISNGLAFIISGTGFTTNDPSQTKIYLTNTPLGAGSTEEIANVYPQFLQSPAFSQNGFGAPALGDQFQLIVSPGTNGTIDTALFGTPYTNGGTIILTNLHIRYMTQSSALGNVDGIGSIFSNGQQGTFYTFEFSEDNGQQGLQQVPFADFQNCQFRLDASATWKYRFTANGVLKGNFYAHFGYCYQGPQSVFTGNFGTSANAKTGSTNINSGNPKAGFQFTASLNCEITSIIFAVDGGGNGTVNQRCLIYTDNAGSPGVQVGSPSATIQSRNGQDSAFNFSTPVPIVNGSVYWVVIDNTDAYGGTNISIETCGNIAGFASGRGATITGLTANLAVDWRVQINYRTQ